MRGLDRRFLDAMRTKLNHGRQRGRTGWDRHWDDWDRNALSKYFIDRLREELGEMVTALASGDSTRILYEAADVANFAMFVADIHRDKP